MLRKHKNMSTIIDDIDYVPNATTADAIHEAKENQEKIKAGLIDNASVDTSSVEAMIQSTLR